MGKIIIKKNEPNLSIWAWEGYNAFNLNNHNQMQRMTLSKNFSMRLPGQVLYERLLFISNFNIYSLKSLENTYFIKHGNNIQINKICLFFGIDRTEACSCLSISTLRYIFFVCNFGMKESQVPLILLADFPPVRRLFLCLPCGLMAGGRAV